MRRSASDSHVGAPTEGLHAASRYSSPTITPGFSNLLRYPLKVGRLLDKPSRRSKSIGLDARQQHWTSSPHSRSYCLDSLVFSVCSDEGIQEVDLTHGTTVALRDGSHIVVPPSHAPSSVPSADSSSTTDPRPGVQILTVQWQSATLGLVLQNIRNRSIIKHVTDAVDLVANPELAHLRSGDELVAINDISAILLGFDATVDRLRAVAKPALLHFRRALVVSPPASEPEVEAASPAPSIPSSISSRDEDDGIVTLPPPSTVPFLQPDSAPPGSDFDVDDARARLGKTEFFPLSTSHNVFTMLRWSGESLGIALQKHPTSGHLEIKFCTGNGLAASHGCLGVGDILVSVAGVPMRAFSLATCLDFLHSTQKPVSMLFRRHGIEALDATPDMISPSSVQPPHEFTVEWEVVGAVQPQGLTLQLFYCNDALVVVVSEVTSSTLQVQIQPGDRLVAVNGLPISSLRPEALRTMLLGTSKLTLHRTTSPWML
ncbi:hypothetical protein, variant [Aphanomyces invadans]|uniref:PDZ domain-containing protein n=1 Tax=Aphanomyces invadans TaxID=157072 RepID=A0A024TXQ3_9STRA|nr:hypothetical protein, variant [Aphanomyces invadans]ETV98142.1 hypothetical protein, variant [Aphanomyces invadans]|eukprot:XP_008873017.1 hypothetical protein, variant [Aphanomyces invadans]